MSSTIRFVLGVVGLAAAFAGFRAEPQAAVATGFGGAVLVGDGEVFVGEATNLFRPGQVYVYRKGASGWAEVAKLSKPDPVVGDLFGSSLTLDGSRLFVGAGGRAVHVFEKQGVSWTHRAAVEPTAVTGAEDVVFGAVGASGDWLLVAQQVQLLGGRGRGANAPPPPSGKVYAFKRNGSGGYDFHSIVTSPEKESAGDGFGSAIAVSGTSALIGAAGHANRAGLVHEFEVGQDGAWTRVRSFAPQGVGPNDGFGFNIALKGTEAIVSAPGDAGNYGAAYVWRKVEQAGRRGGGAGGATPPAGGNFAWQELARLTQPAGGRGSQFTQGIAADGDEIWVSSPRAGGAGGAFVFRHENLVFPLEGPKFVGPASLPVPPGGAATSGQAISVRGGVAAVAAPTINYGGGGVVIFERNASGNWVEQPLITPPIDELPAVTGGEKRCDSKGKVDMFDCASAELVSFLPPSKLTHDGHYIQMNDIWGWTDSRTKKEWALVGRRDGSTFVDMSDPQRPVPVADLPLTEGARPNAWRDIKIYKDHAYIVADGAGPHGMQVFDLTRLRNMKPQSNGLPQKVEADYTYREIASAHNIVINEESGYAYSVGSSAGGTTCGGGLHMIDIREPKLPKFAGCFQDNQTGRAGTGYSHDAQCVTYKGPDKRYKGKEICIGSNETAISIADVTDKTAPKALSRASYPNVSYTHQGWLTEDHKFFYVDDEGDETGGLVPKTRTLIWDLTDLENPKLAKEHLGVEPASDHNLYILGDYMYQANYKSGLRILNIKDRTNPKEVAFFDTAPYSDNSAGFNGAWSVYPFFKSGIIIVNSIEQGLFLVRPSDIPIRR